MDYWEVSGGTTLKIITYTSEDWDYWEVSGDASAKMRTYTSEDWDYWEVSGNYGSLSLNAKIAMVFVPIFTSAIHLRGINK